MEMPPTDVPEEEITKALSTLRRILKSLEARPISSRGWILRMLNQAHAAALDKIPEKE